MKEYLLLLRGGKPMSEKTGAENKVYMDAWGQYMGTLVQEGNLVGGLPVQAEGNTVSASASVAQPVSSEEGIVCGYLILKAENLEHATELAKACPHITNEGNIEVREIAPMPTA